MTEEELERQAKLWHRGTSLESEKTETLRAALMATLPHVRRHRRWQLGGVAALVVTSVPLGGALIVSLSADPLIAQTRIEPLRFPEGKYGINGLALATDGTVAGECAITSGNDGLGGRTLGKQALVWHPGRSIAETLRVPGATLSGLQDFLPNGELVCYVTRQDQHFQIVLWQQGKWQSLPPLPGYSSSFLRVGSDSLRVVSAPRGLVGYSATNKKLDKPQLTLWHNGKPEPLPEGVLPESPWASNTKGDFLLNTKGDFQVYSGGRFTPIPTEGRDSHGQLLWKGIPRHIGENKILIGELEREGQETTIGLWTSPTAQPRPLWEKSSTLTKLPLRCADLDAEGKVVGEMKDPLTGAITPFVWKEGRYRDLQTLLPLNSGWILQGAMRVAGRTVIGMGQYKGEPAVYRLTLPPGCP